MSLDFPLVEAERARQGSLALNQALIGVQLARAELERAASAVALPDVAADAWQGAVRARISDLAQIEEIFEHARNVLGKGRDF